MAKGELPDVSVDLSALQKLPVNADGTPPTALRGCSKTCIASCMDTCRKTWDVEPLEP